MPRRNPRESEENESSEALYPRRSTHRDSRTSRDLEAGEYRPRRERSNTRRNSEHGRRRSESGRRRSSAERRSGGGGGGVGGGSQRRQAESRPDRHRSYRTVPAAPPVAAPPVVAPLLGGEPRRDSSQQQRSNTQSKRYSAPPPARQPPMTEKGRQRRRGGGGGRRRKGRGTLFWAVVAAAVIALLLIILVPIGVLVIGKKKDGEASVESGKRPPGFGLAGSDAVSTEVPDSAKGTLLDSNDWLDTIDFNTTYTTATVAGLSVMGLLDDWQIYETSRANDKVPPLNEAFPYGKQPIRGVNLGGWLLIEPFITPSFFDNANKNKRKGDVIDEYTLSKHLGKDARKVIEKHYSTYVTEQTFKEIRDAGLDHVRIPFGYWAVYPIDGEPYVPEVSFRYLLRAIEYCRKYGLRVKLDLHAVPGGANGWNHSGRLDYLEWLKGPNGEENGDRAIEVHDRLSKFFSQPRYKNVITMYGLVNEPRIDKIGAEPVLAWAERAYALVQKNGFEGKIVMGDGFRGLDAWDSDFRGLDDMVLDVHNYQIFNLGQIKQTHTQKIEFTCGAWKEQLITTTTTGFGPTFVGEWGQADTDCTKYLNNVGEGTRWEGTLGGGGETHCPKTENRACSCKEANAHPDDYSDEYRDFLLMYAEAQMDSFENSWGWMYWTWDTENAYQWSYKKGIKHGLIPKVAYERSFKCGDEVPDWKKRGLPEYY